MKLFNSPKLASVQHMDVAMAVVTRYRHFTALL
jgi:hypothetical protein